MKMCRLLPFILTVVLLFSGCSSQPLIQKENMIGMMEQTDLDSPISGIRTGVWAQGTSLGDNEFECTDDGIYYLCHNIPFEIGTDSTGASTYAYRDFLFFSEHDSNVMIKLCGRPDCLHIDETCNACFENAVGGVSYYNGYLYVAVETLDTSLLSLYRLDINGENRVKVMDLGELAAGYSGMSRAMVTNGVFSFSLSKIDSVTGQKVNDSFFYKLDGSMNKPKKSDNMGFPIGNDGENFMTLAGTTVCLYQFDTDTRKDLFDMALYSGCYYGRSASYALKDSKVVKIKHDNNSEEVIFDTGLGDGYFARFFPDCIVLIEQSSPISSFYFFNWSGENLGKLTIEVPIGLVAEAMTGGESRDRIMIRTSQASIPEYYIEKSDFGTEKIELHCYQYPDLTNDQLQKLFGASSS